MNPFFERLKTHAPFKKWATDARVDGDLINFRVDVLQIPGKVVSSKEKYLNSGPGRILGVADCHNRPSYSAPKRDDARLLDGLSPSKENRKPVGRS
jgi:hypothetical protein